MPGLVRVKRGKRKDTIWIEFSHKGKRYYVSCNQRGYRFESVAQAEETNAILSGQLSAARHGRGKFNPEDWVNSKPRSFEAFAYKWLEHNEDRLEAAEDRISPGTLKGKNQMFRDHFIPYFQGWNIEEIALGVLEDFLKQLPKQWKKKTKKNYISELSAFLQWLWRRGDIPAQIPTPKISYKDKDRPPVEYMTDEEWELVMSHMPDCHKPFFQFLRIYGARPGEACALMWEDFDWRKTEEAPCGRFEIRRTFSAGVLTDRPKSGSFGVLPIVPAFKELLDTLGRNFTGFAFKPPKKPHYTPGIYKYPWRRAVATAGIPYRKLYQATRSSFVCRVLMAGGSYEEAGAVVRHSNKETTKHYGQIFLRQKAKVIELTAEKLRKI